MRVLFVEAPSGYGGSMQSLLELVAYLDESIEPVVACSYDIESYRPLPKRLRVIRFRQPKALGAHAILRLFTRQLGWYRTLQTLLRQVQPNLVHFNNIFFDAFGGAIAVKRKGLPAVSHARDIVVSRRLAHRTVRYYDFHIAISRYVADNLRRYGVPSEACRVIYNPVVPPTARAAFVPSDTPKIGMLGMLQPWKGQHVFIEALHHLQQRGASFRATIAGAEPFGPRGYLERLREMVSRYSLDQRVHFAGFVNDPYRAMTGWDIAVHASIEPEPLGRTVIEAMLYGLPVVATNGGGVPEFVEDGETGLLVPMGDATALADAIGRLLADADLRTRLADAGQRRAREMFDPVKHARAVEGVYQGLCAFSVRQVA